MKINVILITYNHAAYIRQTMESILMQETSAEIEVIIADDCSIDNTVDIIREYEGNAPFPFTYLKYEHNLGYVRNYQQAFRACNGDYVAVMEGDDYWIESYHLQNHIDYLEKITESSMSFNRHLRLFTDQGREEIFDWAGDKNYELITTEQLALDNKIGNLSCCVFRVKYIKALDQGLFDMEIADWMLGMYMGQFGPLLYLKSITSAYRIHDNGQWSKMDEKEQCRRTIELINEYDRYFNYKYTESFTKHKRRLEILLYGDNSFRGRLKSITPAFIRSMYRKIIG